MCVEDCFGNGQAEAQAAELPDDSRLALLEGLKNPRYQLWVHADSRIGYFNTHRIFVFIYGPYCELSARRRELDRIFEEVPEHLLEPDCIAVGQGSLRIQMDLHLQVLLPDF